MNSGLVKITMKIPENKKNVIILVTLNIMKLNKLVLDGFAGS